MSTLYEILPDRLWIRARTNNMTPQAKAALQQELALTRVVQLCPRPDPYWATRVKAWSFRPLADGKRVPWWLSELAAEIAQHLTEGGRALIYCNAGRNRSALLAGMVLVENGMTGTEALAHLRNRRPRCLANLTFENALLTYQPDGWGYR